VGFLGKAVRSLNAGPQLTRTCVQRIRLLAVGRGWNDPDIHLYNVANGREVGTVATPPGTHTSFALAFTPDGKQLVTGISDTSILIWNVHQPE
jgi:WD40 repeat protein